MPLSNFLKWCQESKLRKKLTGTSASKKELVPPSSINPQSQSPFFKLPLEIRIIIYELLFGDRPIHYERDWNETEKKWVVSSFVCFEPTERIDWDECAGRGAANSAKFWEMWKDTGALALCWKGYLETLPIFYGTNEFRFSKRTDLCTRFPKQIPSLGLAMIRRLTLWWTLGPDLQPHISRKNKKNYDSLWGALSSKFPRLTHIRIYIDSSYLADLGRVPKEMSIYGDTNEKITQRAWLEGIEAMVEANVNLEVFEVHFYTRVHRVLKERVKPWLKERETERRVTNSAVRYKAYKCRSTAIKRFACFGTSCEGLNTDISDGSSHIKFNDPQSEPAEFWKKRMREIKQLEQK